MKTLGSPPSQTLWYLRRPQAADNLCSSHPIPISFTWVWNKRFIYLPYNRDRFGLTGKCGTRIGTADLDWSLFSKFLGIKGWATAGMASADSGEGRWKQQQMDDKTSLLMAPTLSWSLSIFAICIDQFSLQVLHTGVCWIKPSLWTFHQFFLTIKPAFTSLMPCWSVGLWKELFPVHSLKFSPSIFSK